jgi:hypothetical protein
MFDIPLLKACIQQQQILEEMVKSPRAVLDRESLAEAVQFYAAFADQLDRSQRCLLFRAGKVNHPETPAIGELLAAIINAALARGYLLRQAVVMAGKVNYLPAAPEPTESSTYDLKGPSKPIDRADDLDRAIERLEKLHRVHVRDWPREVTPSFDEAIAADKNGETQSLAEACAGISGLEPAEWHKRVEDHRRKAQARSAG